VKHAIYFAHGGEQRKQPPPLELILYALGDDPVEMEKAGYDYTMWLLRNASGTWVKGLRRALAEHPSMFEPGEPLPYEEGSKNEGP
jgi:hypothetical protein